MKVMSTNDLPKSAVAQFFSTHWGSPVMVNSNGSFQCDELEGYAALDEKGDIIGLITFVMDENECEIISLDSIVENKGIGSALLKEAEQASKQKRCEIVKLITTNDNIRAIGFYQKRGYVFAELHVNAVEKARKIKPEIPLKADNGIPIRDELLFVKKLRAGNQ
ncbi:GNAT family N-acetyltransferase [Bacillus glycinifermentans]|uniref:GNAT family N-acetyltransferase n=1 Tax=Bacillus glycinifermentans TaxID=1664069 RepID=UPI001FF6C5C7|nr:GNAT family N-acetyltransferase [Bacillus glycinifermentans]UOY88783.1 GNAT family N-acetyltransferase [Bacillus glycinifermentans]